MAITSILGFDEFLLSHVPSTNDLDHYGGIPLVALNSSVGYSRYPESYFKTRSIGGRGWLESVPARGNRRPVTQFYSSGTGTYRTRCRQVSTNHTNSKRRNDSHKRTPCLGLRLAHVYGGYASDSRVRYYRLGFRLYRGMLNTQPTNSEFLTLHSSLSKTYRTGGVVLLTTTAILNAAGSSEVYIELEFDTYNNRITRWINNTSLGSISYGGWSMSNMGLQWGEKSEDLSGFYYRSHCDYNTASYPPQNSTGSIYDGAPPDLDYRLTDFYFQVDTRDIETTPSHNDRLGDIQIKTLDPRQLQLAPGWTPHPTINSLDVVRRPRMGESVDTTGIHGDLDATNATITLDVPVIDPEDEVIYTETSVWASPANVATAVDLKVIPLVGTTQSPVKTITLPGENNFRPRDHYVAHRIESVPLDPGLEKTTLGRLQFKLGFDAK